MMRRKPLFSSFLQIAAGGKPWQEAARAFVIWPEID
jgi:hypothetical protein